MYVCTYIDIYRCTCFFFCIGRYMSASLCTACFKPLQATPQTQPHERQPCAAPCLARTRSRRASSLLTVGACSSTPTAGVVPTIISCTLLLLPHAPVSRTAVGASTRPETQPANACCGAPTASTGPSRRPLSCCGCSPSASRLRALYPSDHAGGFPSHFFSKRLGITCAQQPQTVQARMQRD